MMLILTRIAVLALISKVLLNQSSIKHKFVFYTFEQGRISIDSGKYEHHLNVLLNRSAAIQGSVVKTKLTLTC